MPAHGTVIYRVRPLRTPDTVEPLVTTGAAAGTLIPGPAGGTPTTTATNHGDGALKDVTVTVRAPEGWTVTATTSNHRRSLGADASPGTMWTVLVPEATAAGSYPIRVTTAYAWGPRRRAGSSASELVAAVVAAPPDGRRHLSGLAMAGAANARGPVELDRSPTRPTAAAWRRSAAFHTGGAYGLEVTTPVTGNWYGRVFDEPLDLGGTTMLTFDVRAAETGPVGEIAEQDGDDLTWCRGGRWAWTNPRPA